jgi:hypothetical protein
LCCRGCTFNRTADDPYAPFSFARKQCSDTCSECEEEEGAPSSSPPRKSQRVDPQVAHRPNPSPSPVSMPVAIPVLMPVVIPVVTPVVQQHPEEGAPTQKSQKPELRHYGKVKAIIKSLRKAEPGTDFARIFSQHGLNKLYFAFDTEYFNDINPMTIAPQDILHLFPDGLLRSECAWLFYILIKLGLDLDEANAALRKGHRRFSPGIRVPPFHAKLKNGAVGGTPTAGAVMRMTGSQMMEFTKHR